MATPWRGWGLATLGLALLGLAQVGLLIWGSQAGSEAGSDASSDAGRQLLAVLGSSGLGALAMLWLALDRRLQRVPIWASLALAFVLRALCTQATPLLEDDHFRYLWDGLRTATTLDPYRLPPAAFFGDAVLPRRWQDILSGINNPHLPTIYGPLLQGLFALAYGLTPGKLAGLQWLMLCADMAVLCLLARQSLRRNGRHRRPNINPRWLLAYALHPLLLREGVASAHPDILVGLLLLCSVLAWQAERAALTGLFWALALASKVSAAVALPLLMMAPAAAHQMHGVWRAHGHGHGHGHAHAHAHGLRNGPWHWCLRLAGGAVATLALIYLPFIWVGGSELASLRVFGNSWRFNPLFYRLLELVLPPAAVRAGAALCVVLALLGLALWWRRRDPKTAANTIGPPLHLALIALLICAPVVNPWYWLWVMPLAPLLGHPATFAVACAAFVSYLNSTVMADAGWAGGHFLLLADPPPNNNPFWVPWPLAWLQGAALLGGSLLSGLVCRVRRRANRKPGQR
jgi:hypothetical protein